MISVVLGFAIMLFALGGLLMYRANQQVDVAIRRRRWTKFLVYIVIVHTVILSAAFGYFPWLAGIIIIIGFYEVCSINSHKGFVKTRSLTITLTLLSYLLLAFGSLMFSLTSSLETIIFVYLIVAAFDGFSQVTGQLIGRHQLVSRISPGKTLEGTFGGLYS
jgi:CDP-diglyceride synthetase